MRAKSSLLQLPLAATATLAWAAICVAAPGTPEAPAPLLVQREQQTKPPPVLPNEPPAAAPTVPDAKNGQDSHGAKPGNTPGAAPHSQVGPGPQKPGLKPGEKPGLAVAQPRSAAERDRALANLYAHLATAEDEKQARTVSASIEALWATPGSDTISYLMQRAHGAIHTKKMDLALQLYDRVVALAPDYAEGWNQRAIAHIHNKDYERAMGDVRRTLALDPNHFRALDGLFHILSETGRKKEALKVGRQLLEVNPFYEGARQAVDELAREIEGRGI